MNPFETSGIRYLDMKVLVFAGSIRKDSFHRKLGRAAAEALREQGLEVTLADLSDYPMPFYDGDVEAEQGLPPGARAFKQLVREHDGLAIASPEYNGSFPALTKNAIDWVSRSEAGEPRLAAFQGKKAMLLSTSPGPGGGKRGMRHLRELLEMIGVSVAPTQVAIAKATAAFGPDGALLREEDREALRHAAAELAESLRIETKAA